MQGSTIILSSDDPNNGSKTEKFRYKGQLCTPLSSFLDNLLNAHGPLEGTN